MASEEKNRTRATKRSAEEKMEDAFFDLSLKDQARMLEMFQKLHRLKARQGPEAKKPADDLRGEDLDPEQAKLAMES